MTHQNKPTVNVMDDDRPDGCRVGFATREYVAGARGHLLDGVVVRLFKVYIQEHPNRHYSTLDHHNLGYAIAEIVVEIG